MNFDKIVSIIIIAGFLLSGIYFSYLAKNRSDIRKLFSVIIQQNERSLNQDLIVDFKTYKLLILGVRQQIKEIIIFEDLVLYSTDYCIQSEQR